MIRLISAVAFLLLVVGCGGQPRQAKIETQPPAPSGAVVETESTTADTAVPAPAGVSFSGQVQPIFAASCIACHSPKGSVPKYDLTTYSSVAKLVVAGEAEKSKLYTILKQGKMPPSGKLSEDKLELIRNWINQGAKDN